MAKVINLDAWAGDDFAHAPGAEIDLPDEVAAARVAAGVAAWPAGAEPVAVERAGKRERTAATKGAPEKRG